MNGRTGGKTNPERDHEQNVEFHPQNAAELAEYLKPHFSPLIENAGTVEILDACAGTGVLGDALVLVAENCDKSGIVKINLSKIDTLYSHDILEERGEFDIIVCNPPWRLKIALPIYNHLLSLLAPGGVLLFVVNLVFCYQGSDRAEVLQYQKYYFLPRWTFKPAGRPFTGVIRKEYESIGSWSVPEQPYFDELCRVSKNQIIWGINYFHFAGLMPGRIIWDKVNGASSFSDCEIAYNSMTSRVDLFRYMWNGMLQGKNITEGFIQQGDKSKNEKRIHPTQKPVALYKWLLSRYAKPGYKILDTHLGSGSSRIAAYDMGFDFYATETDKEYFDAGITRFNAYRAQGNLFEAGDIFLPNPQELFQEAMQ